MNTTSGSLSLLSAMKRWCCLGKGRGLVSRHEAPKGATPILGWERIRGRTVEAGLKSTETSRFNAT